MSDHTTPSEVEAAHLVTNGGKRCRHDIFYCHSCMIERITRALRERERERDEWVERHTLEVSRAASAIERMVKAEREVERLRGALTRIHGGESPVRGLRPELYGHAIHIAHEALGCDDGENYVQCMVALIAPPKPCGACGQSMDGITHGRSECLPTKESDG